MKYLGFCSLIHESFGTSPYQANERECILCSHHWKYVICISAFLFIFTLYLFEFPERKEPKVINENNRDVNLQTFSLEICSVCSGVMLRSWSGKSGVWFALDFWMKRFRVGLLPKSQQNGWTHEKSLAEGKNKFCTSPLQKLSAIAAAP